MSDFRVTGAGQLRRLSTTLNAVADGELRKEMTRGLRLASKPLIAQTRQAAREELPKRGGLNELVARAPQRVSVRTGARTTGVRISAGKKGSGARGADRGVVRHPVFFHPPKKLVWADDQQVPAGWFTKTLERSAPTVLPFVQAGMDDIRRKLLKGGG